MLHLYDLEHKWLCHRTSLEEISQENYQGRSSKERPLIGVISERTNGIDFHWAYLWPKFYLGHLMSFEVSGVKHFGAAHIHEIWNIEKLYNRSLPKSEYDPEINDRNRWIMQIGYNAPRKKGQQGDNFYSILQVATSVDILGKEFLDYCKRPSGLGGNEFYQNPPTMEENNYYWLPDPATVVGVPKTREKLVTELINVGRGLNASQLESLLAKAPK